MREAREYSPWPFLCFPSRDSYQLRKTRHGGYAINLDFAPFMLVADGDVKGVLVIRHRHPHNGCRGRSTPT